MAARLLLGAVVGMGVMGPARASVREDVAASDRTWIKHKVVPKETLDTIAARYGVTRAELVKWNRNKVGKKQWIYARQVLKVHARIVRPPRAKTSYTIRKGDTWGKIAKRFGVPVRDVRAWNPKVKGLIAEKKLTIYTDPRAQAATPSSAVAGPSTAALPEIDVRGGGYGVGAPNRGHLVNGVALPPSEMVRIFDPRRVWGTSHTIEHLLQALTLFRQRSGYEKPLTVTSISLEHGGRLQPHSSHRTGRDVDIRLPRTSRSKGDAPSKIDWNKTWDLVKALIDTGEVEYIFISWSRQKYLYKAAKRAGMSKKELARFIQYPRKPKARTQAKVRHSSGHTIHLHVRFTCTPKNSLCKSY